VTVKSISGESVPADTLVRPVGVLALGHGVTVVEVEQAFVVVGAAVLQVALQRVPVIT
jgi:hypothetical protein